MNALPVSFLDQPRPLRFERMNEDSLDEVMEIEIKVFPFPWTRKVFQSTIREGYDCWVARDTQNILVGYFVLMRVVDEVHLLTIAVHGELHGQGVGRKLLDNVIELARGMKIDSLLLEVRPSNERALEIYHQYGFMQIGRRMNYYVAPNNTREDALVMRLKL
jgi:[ribosomal protein S18]-alanine N-acetyltransferase